MKKILLIPAINVFASRIRPYMPLGLLSLQAIAAEFNNEIDIFFYDLDLCSRQLKDSEELAEIIISNIALDDYDIIGLSCKCNSFHHSLRIAKLIKTRKPEIKVIMGGPHATVLAKEILSSFSEIDAIFAGESENTVKEVLERRTKGSNSLEDVPGIMTRSGSYTPPQLTGNLDELPFVYNAKDFKKFVDILPSDLREEIPENTPEEIPIEAARGCPCRCTFCSTRMFWGDSIRYKSSQRVILEMEYLQKMTGCGSFAFIGDNFASIKKNLISFCDYLIDNKYNFKWRSYLRLNVLEKEDLDKLWKAGCKKFFVGIESASKQTLKKIKKSINLEHELELIKHAISLGFQVETSFIIGFPWETKEDIKQTYDLHCKLLEWGVHRSDVRILCPLPGTELTDEYEIEFDNVKSSISYDDLPIDKEFEENVISKKKDIFCHFGFYKNEFLQRFDLASTVYNAQRLGLKHTRKKAKGLT